MRGRSSREAHHEPARAASQVRLSRPRQIPSRSIDRLFAGLSSRSGSLVCTPLRSSDVFVLLQAVRRTIDLPFSEQNPDMTERRYQSGGYSTLAYGGRHAPKASETTKSAGLAGLDQRSPKFGRSLSPRPYVQNYSLRSGDVDPSKPLCSKAGVHAAPGTARTRAGRVV
jgi:hypothetical protein